MAACSGFEAGTRRERQVGMNNVILDLIPAGGKTPADGTAGGATTKAATAVDAGLFRTALAGSVRSAKAAATPAQTTFVPADTATLQALQTKISKLLVGGAPQADVIAALAAQLASSVAQTVQTPGADAPQHLADALCHGACTAGARRSASAPVGERALSLAQRFTRSRKPRQCDRRSTVRAAEENRGKRFGRSTSERHPGPDNDQRRRVSGECRRAERRHADSRRA